MIEQLHLPRRGGPPRAPARSGPSAPDTREAFASSETAPSLAALFVQFASGAEGLRASDAAARLVEQGPNKIDTQRPRRLLLSFLTRFLNPLVLVLLAASAISAVTGDVASSSIIATIILISVIMDVVQEHRAEDAAAGLRAQVSLTAKVLRDGTAAERPAAELVTGDVVLLSAGDLVPADGRLIEARDLYVNEALLTGESYPAEKAPVAEAATPDGVRAGSVYMGSSVVSGTGKALVIATGWKAQLGSIAGSLRRDPPPTAFALGIRDFGLMIVRVTILLVLGVLLVDLLFHRPVLESFLFAAALAVGLTPELLPMVVSVTLAHGAIRMSRKQVIVKRLSAIHDLGSMDVLCSDKTGTLTEAHIKLVREVDLHGRPGTGVTRLAQLNAGFETGLKSPLDDAIMEAGAVRLEDWRKIDEVPFDFERRRVSVLVEGEGSRRLIVKGAPEDVLAHASRYQGAASAPAPLDRSARQQAEETFNQLGAEGFRVLAVAWREAEPGRDHADISDETDLIFAGFLAFLDPPKAGARQALDELAGLGVAVKVVTGDNEQVTRHVCQELGLAAGGILTGPEIAKLSDDALAAKLDGTNLFCRVTPPQKSRIITALRRKGHVVGYLGDGINDAPSLHAADVGFSVDTAVDVAKEAACMILLRKDLDALAEGVREGRKTFANILKYIMMGTSSNFGNMFSMAGGVLFLPFLPMLPVQILLNNLLYDLSETTIPLDHVDPRTVARPRHWDLAVVRKFMLFLGPLSSAFDFVTFAILLKVFHTGEALFHTAWFVESLATQVLVIFIIRTARPLRDWPHPLLVLSSLAAILVAVMLPYTAAGLWFGFVPIPGPMMIALSLVALVYLGCVSAVKRWLFTRYGLA